MIEWSLRYAADDSEDDDAASVYDDSADPVRTWLRWSEVKSAYARGGMRVWEDDAELDWMEGAWRLLEQRGLTRYSTASEHFDVLMRVVALAWLYNSFCNAAVAEGSGASESWANALGAHPVWCERQRLSVRYDARLRQEQLARDDGVDKSADPVGEEPDEDEDDDADDTIIDREIWLSDVELEAHDAYRAVRKALLAAVGGHDELFFFLLLSRDRDFAGRFPISTEGRSVAHADPHYMNGAYMWAQNGFSAMQFGS